MSKHLTDHDRSRDDSKVAREYARIEREQGDSAQDPKVRAMTRAAHADEAAAEEARLRAFLKIDREAHDS